MITVPRFLLSRAVFRLWCSILLLALGSHASAAIRYQCGQETAVSDSAPWKTLQGDEGIHLFEADFGHGTECVIEARVADAHGSNAEPVVLALTALAQSEVKSVAAGTAQPAAPLVWRSAHAAALLIPPQGVARARVSMLLPIGSTLHARIEPLSEFIARDARDSTIRNALLAVLLAMGLVSAVFAAAMRDRIVGWYSGFTVLMSIMWGMLSGLAIEPTHLAASLPWLTQSLLVLAYGGVIFCGLNFARRFTRTERLIPQLDRWLSRFAWAVVAYSCVGLLPFCYMPVMSYYNLVGLVALLAMLVPGFASIRYGQARLGAVYLIGWLPIIVVWVGVLLLYLPEMPGYPTLVTRAALAIRQTGILPEWLSSAHLRQAALLLQAIIFSLALADRSARIRKIREHSALTDKVTGLPNRNHFMLRAGRLLQQHLQQPHTLILMDINRFGTINEALGYDVGDQVLLETGRRIARKLGRDALLARVGGNQFAALVNDAIGEGTLRLLVASMARQTIDLDGERLDIDLTVGAASSPEHSVDIDALMRCTEIALANAKSEQRAVAVYHSALERDRRFQLSLLSGLRSAMSESQLQLYLQPKVSLHTRRVTGAETLLRWHHPVHGLLTPRDFVPFAVQTGLIVELTRWMVEQALLLAKSWQNQGLDLRLSVNLSAADLADPNLPAYLSELLMHSRANASKVCLEITESEVLRDPKLALSSMAALRTLGFELALDDFGTGNSALAYLQDMPVSEVKIDRSFISNARHQARGRKLLASVASMSHALDMRVVAEGVENEADWQMTAEAGCDEVQGYYVSAPMSAARFAEWVSVNQPFVGPIEAADLTA